MIPPPFGVDHWRPPKFTGHKNHRALQQTPLLQILHQCRETLIEEWSQGTAKPVFVVVVRIPLAVLVTGSRNESAAGLHQPSSQEHALADTMAAVLVFRFLRLLRKIEGLLDARVEQHLERLLLECIHLRKLGQLFFLAEVTIDDFQHRAAIVDGFGSSLDLGRLRFGS